MEKFELKITLFLLGIFLVGSIANAADLKNTQTSKKAKILSFNIKANGNKPIPRLSLPSEGTVDLSSYQLNSSVKTLSLNLKPKLQSPDKFKKNIQVQIASPNARAFVTEKALLQIPTWKDMPDIKDPNLKTADVVTKKISELTPDEYRLVQATLLYEIHNQSELVMPLVADLLNHKTLQNESRYLYTLSSYALGLFTEYRFQMIKVAENTQQKTLTESATRHLIEHAESLTLSDVPTLEKLSARDQLNTEGNISYQLLRAKYFLEQGTLGETEYSLEQIPKDSPFFGEARLISGLYNYRRGQVDQALTDLKIAFEHPRINPQNKDLTALTLARIYFQKQQYKEAQESYLKVNKNSPYWLQAMIEQAWTQILIQDFEGAAGNMYTLHTDYFKNAFAPESYLVRTVSYLNLCQYGDGMATLSNLKNKYGPTLEKAKNYQSQIKDNSKYYDTIKTMLKNPKEREIEGLPKAFIIELARHPSFMKTQGRINQLEDEFTKLSELTPLLATLESAVIKRTEKNKTLKYWIPLIQKAKSNFSQVTSSISARMEPEKTELRKVASNSLKKRFQEMTSLLESTLDQTDVLQYELLSGAGENIRYQMAGGEAQKDKSVINRDKTTKWSFKGEVWEDEIGHFKSGLKNICSQNQ